MSIEDLVNQCGQQNIPGVKTTVYLVAEEDVDTIPDVVGGALPGDKLTISAAIVLKPNKFWAQFTIVADTGEVKDSQLGVVGSRSWQSTFDFKIPFTGSAVAQWVQERSNSCFLALVCTKQGNVRLLGHIGIPVRQETAELTTGMAPDSERVATVNWLSTTGNPALFYTGTIDLDPLT